MNKIIGIFVFLMASVGLAKVVCDDEKQNDWVKMQRIAIEKDELFKFGKGQFGPLVSCNGKVNHTEINGQKFGIMTFVFKKSAKMTVETMPPESLVVKLEVNAKFPNADVAMNRLKSAVKKTGLKIDYKKSPEIQKSNDIETKTFWDTDTGNNGRAFLVYKAKKLVGIGYGMAL